jgi:ABC-type bacteriocin/lantibiotic exporter with double-glycine peptidase domain
MALSWFMGIGLAVCGLFPLVGCTHTLPTDLTQKFGKEPLYVEGIPFYPQKKYQCGPASLAAVLNFWGQNDSPEQIAQAIYLPRLKGSLSLDLWRYASDKGYDARMQEGSLEKLQAHLARKQPVIAFLNLGLTFFPIGHFLVVVGLDPKQQVVIAYSGTEKDKRIPYREFLSDWKKTRYWSLVITPKDGPASGLARDGRGVGASNDQGP